MMTDPRLVALYDLDNPAGPDHDYFRSLADRLDARTIVDLGCGTGMLTVTLARPGRRVIGIDPDAGMLDWARRRDGADRVTCIQGDSRALAGIKADLVVMSGNVAQHIVGDAWPRTLHDIQATLSPGGVLGFESRNPAVREWTRWTREHTYGTRDTPSGPLTEWLQVTEVTDDGMVTFEAYNRFDATGEQLVVRQTLAFRSREQIESDLAQAGLTVTAVWGGWRQEPVTPTARVMVFEAVRPA